MSRRLHLERAEDVSGVSGTGIVAYGVEFPDGSVVLRWDTKVRSTVFYDSIQDVEVIVGHGGRTRVVWDDDAEPGPWTKARILSSMAWWASGGQHEAARHWEAWPDWSSPAFFNETVENAAKWGYLQALARYGLEPETDS